MTKTMTPKHLDDYERKIFKRKRQQLIDAKIYDVMDVDRLAVLAQCIARQERSARDYTESELNSLSLQIDRFEKGLGFDLRSRTARTPSKGRGRPLKGTAASADEGQLNTWEKLGVIQGGKP